MDNLKEFILKNPNATEEQTRAYVRKLQQMELRRRQK